jgi:hypothetical protein
MAYRHDDRSVQRKILVTQPPRTPSFMRPVPSSIRVRRRFHSRFASSTALAAAKTPKTTKDAKNQPTPVSLPAPTSAKGKKPLNLLGDTKFKPTLIQDPELSKDLNAAVEERFKYHVKNTHGRYKGAIALSMRQTQNMLKRINESNKFVTGAAKGDMNDQMTMHAMFRQRGVQQDASQVVFGAF